MTAALEGGEWSAARPGRNLPPGKTLYPFYRRLGGPQGRSGWMENLVPTGIRSPDSPVRSQSLYRMRYPTHWEALYKFHICSSVHRNSRLKKKIQQDVTVYRYLFTAKCFGCPSHRSSGVHKTVVVASGTGHTIWEASFLKRDQLFGHVWEKWCDWFILH